MSLSPLLYFKFLTFCIIGPQINISSPPPPKNCKVKQKGKKKRTKLGSIEHHLSFVKTQGSQRAFSCVFFLSSYYFREDGTKAFNKLSAIFFFQIPSLLHDRCHEKKSFFSINLFSPFLFYKSLKIQIFPTRVYTISFGYLDRLSQKEKIYANFH